MPSSTSSRQLRQRLSLDRLRRPVSGALAPDGLHLDTVVLPRWNETPLREVSFEDLQVWVTGLSVAGSVRFEGKGLSASRVRQAHQLVGAVLRFAVKAKHPPAIPAKVLDLPDLPEAEQRYLTHEQLHRVAVAAGRLRTLALVLGYCGLRFGEAPR